MLGAEAKEAQSCSEKWYEGSKRNKGREAEIQSEGEGRCSVWAGREGPGARPAGLAAVMGWESIDHLLRSDKAAASRIYHRLTIPVMATACYLETETLRIFGV